MTDPTFVFVDDKAGRPSIVANFALFAGREATPAEIERLGDALLERVEPVEVVCELRYAFDRDRRASVYQVRVELPEHASGDAAELATAVEAWMRECIAERPLIAP